MFEPTRPIFSSHQIEEQDGDSHHDEPANQFSRDAENLPAHQKRNRIAHDARQNDKAPVLIGDHEAQDR